MERPSHHSDRALRFVMRSLTVALASFLVVSEPTIGSAGTAQLEPDDVLRYRPVYTESGQKTVLADIDSITSPEVSPDGRKVAFSGSVGNESLGRYALFVVNTNGSGLTQVTSGSYAEFDPAWSPDGRYLSFSQNTTGSLSISSCCRIARIDMQTSVINALTTPTGAIRPAVSPSGALLSFDNPSGVWTMPAAGGAAVLRVQAGFDSTFSPDSGSLAYVANVGGLRRLRTINLSSGAVATIYSTSGSIESPVWRGGRIYFLHHTGLGYDGRSAVQIRSIRLNGLDLRVESATPGRIGLDLFDNDELLFYRLSDGFFSYYEVGVDATLTGPTHSGNYSLGWDSIAAIDLNGNGRDEQLFYRPTNGAFKYYESKANGALGPIVSSGIYSTGWSSVSSIDVDGDGRDEQFFYRSADGVFKYYTSKDTGLGPILSSGTYSKGWSSITGVDVNGDGKDEQLFYREADGVFKYYAMKASGELGALLSHGTYSLGWDSISAVDLDGDGKDELVFFRSSDGLYKYYRTNSAGSLGSLIDIGTFSSGWDSITAIQLGIFD